MVPGRLIGRSGWNPGAAAKAPDFLLLLGGSMVAEIVDGTTAIVAGATKADDNAGGTAGCTSPA